MALLEKLFNSNSPEIPKTRVAVLGLDQAGKTTILNFLRTGEMTETVPTFGVNSELLRYSKLYIQIWDLGGQPVFRSYWRGFVKQANAVIFVVDSSDHQRIPEAASELQRVLRIIDNEEHSLVFNERTLQNQEVPVIIIANKQDKAGALSKNEILDYLKLNNYRGGPWHIQEANARSGEGISEAFRWIYERVTGERLPAPLSIREVVIFNSSGINIAQTRCGEIANPALVSGFLTAIDIFAHETLERNLDTLVLGDRKLTYRRFGEIIGVIVMNVENSDAVARDVLGEILSRIKKSGEQHAQQILDAFMRNELPFYLSLTKSPNLNTQKKSIVEQSTPLFSSSKTITG
ncbi:MAG: ADP-ribosylation factor family protein [Promethearchaeota archaeon]